MCQNRKSIRPQTEIWEGSEFPETRHADMHGIDRLFALHKFRRCQSYFSARDFQILDFPWCVPDVRGPAAVVCHLGISRSRQVPQFSSGFDFRRMYRNCRNGKVQIVRGSKIHLVPDSSRNPCVAKDGFGLGASSWFRRYPVFGWRKSFPLVLPRNCQLG